MGGGASAIPQGPAAREIGMTAARDFSFERLLERAQALGARSGDVDPDGKSRPAGSGGAAGDGDAALREAVREFEALFIHHIIKGMRRTVPEGGLFEKSFAREVYEDMMDQETAKSMASAGGIGLADLLYDQLSGKR